MSNVVVRPAEEQQKYKDILRTNNTDRVILFDRSKAYERLSILRHYLPSVIPYYAIKSSPHMSLVSALHDFGCNFDIATNGEIDILKHLGIRCNKTIHTHPIKTVTDIQYSLDYGCNTFVVDNMHEIHKFIPFKKQANLLLRLSFPNPEAIIDLSRKFGCTPEQAPQLLDECNRLGLTVIGLSFHVGSQTKNSNRHIQAIDVCEQLARDYGLCIIDIGGGFPVDYYQQSVNLDQFFIPLNDRLQHLDKSIQVISEPGRFISGPCFTSICSIVGISDRIDARWYYINDGLYGTYSGVAFDHIEYNMHVFSDDKQCTTSVLTGPTCDSIDVVVKKAWLPQLNIGDVVVGFNMGAYTYATSTTFNSISKTLIVDV